MRMRSRSDRVKIEDVAREAGVSIMSVSRAMRGVEGVSAKKRQEILDIARRLRYSPSSVAGSLAAADSKLIGVSVPTLDDAVFGEIFAAMRASFLKAGYQTVFDTSYYEESHEEIWVERMIAWRPAGIVLSGTQHSKRTARMLRRSGIPTLEIWAHSQDPIDICVGIDHADAGYQMALKLIELGYRRPAYVGAKENYDKRAQHRFEGFRRAFKEEGSQFGCSVRMDGLLSFEGGRAGTAKLLKSARTAFDVVYFLNDHMAFGGMMEMEARGIDVPGDIGIVGFNGLRINNVLNKQITTSITPRTEMGELGARTLLARINGLAPIPSAALPVKIRLGDTTSVRGQTDQRG